MSEQPLYPLRNTEFLSQESPFPEIDPLQLTPEERHDVLQFEAGLFEQLEPVRKLSPEVHTVYPEYFTSQEGWEEFRNFYSEADPRVLVWEKPNSPEAVAALFYGLENLSQIDKDKRSKLATKTMTWARDRFIEDVLEKQGNLDGVANPLRISRIINPKELRAKAEGYRELKRQIKEMESGETEENDLSKARKIILNMYRRYINASLAQLYDEGAILANQPNLSEEEKEALSALRGRRLKEDSVRTLERIDKFLQGSGLELKNGYFEVIPQKFSEYVEKRSGEYTREETEEYKRYKGIKVDSETALKLCNHVLEKYGLSEKGWKAQIREDKTSFSVNYLDQGKVVKRINIPKDLNRPLPDVLRVIAHELEGHVLRHANRDLLPLKLLQTYSTGRSESLAEAGAVWVEDQSLQKMFDMKRAFRGVYYRALKKKLEGGSFKDCFGAILEASDGSLLRSKAKTAFRQALRIFRAGRIPLNDTSGRIVNSEELAYHEPVAAMLSQLGWEKLLFLPAIDLYSVTDLQKLGILDFKEIKAPEFVVAEKIWPELKAKIDRA